MRVAAKANRSWRDVIVMLLPGGAFSSIDVGPHVDMPAPKIVAMRIDGCGSSRARRNVFEQFDAGPGGGTKCGDAQTRAEDVVQTFMLDAIVLAVTRDTQAEGVAVATEAGVGVSDDGGVVGAAGNPPIRFALPFGGAFTC